MDFDIADIEFIYFSLFLKIELTLDFPVFFF
jgi:hypothetical protein